MCIDIYYEEAFLSAVRVTYLLHVYNLTSSRRAELLKYENELHLENDGMK